MTEQEADGKEGIYSLQPARDAALEALRAKEKLAYATDRNKFAAAALTGLLAGGHIAIVHPDGRAIPLSEVLLAVARSSFILAGLMMQEGAKDDG